MTLSAYQELAHKKFANNQVVIEAVENLAMISVAVPKGGEKKLGDTLKKAFGLGIPKIGQSETAGKFIALGMQAEQFLLLLPYASPQSPIDAQKAIGATGYTTDQSDGWVFVRMKGKRVNEALQRICKLDLERFNKGQAARTSMEHLGVIIYAEDTNDYLLMSARSSAVNFWHALVTSAENLL